MNEAPLISFRELSKKGKERVLLWAGPRKIKPDTQIIIIDHELDHPIPLRDYSRDALVICFARAEFMYRGNRLPMEDGDIFHHHAQPLPVVRPRAVAAALIFLCCLLGVYAWSPWTEPVVADSVMVEGYKSLKDLPEKYLDLVPKLKAAVISGKPVERKKWNDMIQSLVVFIQQYEGEDPKLIPLYDDILKDDGIDEGTKCAVSIMRRLQVQTVD